MCAQHGGGCPNVAASSSQQSSVVRHIVSASRHRISTPHSRPGSDAGTASDVPPPAGADGGASSVESEAPLGTDAPSPSLPLAPSALATAAAATGPAAAASQAGALRLLVRMRNAGARARLHGWFAAR